MENRKIKVGITHGDYNGIGYEIILKALEDPLMLDLCTPVVYGCAKIATATRKALEMPPLPHQRIDSAADARDGVINIVNVVDDDEQPHPGQPSEAAGRAALAALERATAALKAGAIDVLVTAPIDKATIQSPEFHFPGHTEYLEASLGEEGDHALMIMAHPCGLRVALATVHIPLERVAESLTRELIERKISEFALSLTRDFGVHSPRIAVLALNPHAGDSGLLGTEEAEIIAPAIEAANANRILAFGPYAADGFFGAGNHSRFDGILAMYHDQGLIPFKALCGSEGVNFTAGLPAVRTSPDHGTAYDIAGRGKADAQSMRQAIYMAIDALRNRAVHSEITANPLKKLYQDRNPRES